MIYKADLNADTTLGGDGQTFNTQVFYYIFYLQKKNDDLEVFHEQILKHCAV